jgi:hypothetical protein
VLAGLLLLDVALRLPRVPAAVLGAESSLSSWTFRFFEVLGGIAFVTVGVFDEVILLLLLETEEYPGAETW